MVILFLPLNRIPDVAPLPEDVLVIDTLNYFSFRADGIEVGRV